MSDEEQKALDAVAAIEADAEKTLAALGQARGDLNKAQTDLQTVTNELAAANVLTVSQRATLDQVSQRLTAVDTNIDAAVPDPDIPVVPSEPTPADSLGGGGGG